MKYLQLLIFLVAANSASLAQVFFDDFDGKKLDRRNWIKADKKWGGKRNDVDHGGVVPENAYIEKGQLVLRANGDLYDGKIKGHGQKHRVGAAVYSKKQFASARYEIRAKICPQVGVLSSLWTFRYESDSVNHEIDFELPGKSPTGRDLQWGMLTNWTGLSESEHRSVNKYIGQQADGDYHIYRFDWHIGNGDQDSRIEWYFDNQLVHTSKEAIPFKPSKFWIGVWFPWWLNSAAFVSDYMYVDWIKISAL